MTEPSKSSEPEKLPPGKPKNRRTPAFHELFADLPPHIQELSHAAFKLFCKDPAHPSLKHHQLKDNKRGSHKPGSFAIYINMQYRSIYHVVDGVNVWYWTGSHAAYNRFTGGR